MKRQNDEGSVLVLGIGLSLVCIMLATVVINVATLWMARSALNSIADGAALAGVQSLDKAAVYKSHSTSIIHLNSGDSKTKVRSYISRSQVKSQVHGLTLTSVDVSGQSVQVSLSATPAVPFRYLWGNTVIVARAKARATMILR